MWERKKKSRKNNVVVKKEHSMGEGWKCEGFLLAEGTVGEMDTCREEKERNTEDMWGKKENEAWY